MRPTTSPIAGRARNPHGDMVEVGPSLFHWLATSAGRTGIAATMRTADTSAAPVGTSQATRSSTLLRRQAPERTFVELPARLLEGHQVGEQ